MKIFLYSLNLTKEHVKAIVDLCKKDQGEISVALIENAADVITEGPDGWLVEIRDSIKKLGFKVSLVDLRQFIGNERLLEEQIRSSDIIWIGGGNMYYLRYILHKTRADRIITQLINAGKVYCGWSAGGCVAGPTLLDGEIMDDVTQAEEKLYAGLNLVDFVMVPHIDNDLFAENAKKWNQKLRDRGFVTIPLKDDQGIVINGENISII